MSARSALITEYIACPVCRDAARTVLSYYSVQEFRGIIAATGISGTNFIAHVLPELDAALCHPLRVAFIDEHPHRQSLVIAHPDREQFPDLTTDYQLAPNKPLG